LKAPFNPIRNINPPSFKKFNEKKLGIDLFDHGFDLQWATNDDYQLIAGLGNLRQAIYHRLITNPGELFAHPDYGAGLEEYVSAPFDGVLKNEIMSRIKQQLLKEPRIFKINHIRLRTGDKDTQIGTVIIDIGVTPIGSNDVQAFQYAITERDWQMLH
jgi:phage baseplate assembly protein W